MMIKRILSVLVLLTMITAFSALAEEASYEKIGSALYRIVLRTEDGDETLGSGVLFLEKNILLTAEACCQRGDLYAIGEDGEHQILAWERADQFGVALMEMLTPSACEPLNFAGPDMKALPFLFGANGEGKIGSVPLYQARRTIYRGQEAMVFSSEEGLLPGAFAADVNGGIMGLVLAQQAEGKGMYIALDPDGLYSAMVGTTEGQTDAASGFIAGLTVTEEPGCVTVSWADADLPEGAKVMTYCLYEGNTYYTYHDVQAGLTKTQFFTVPGVGMSVWAVWSTEENPTQRIPQSYRDAYFTVPAAPEAPFTEYGFTNLHLSVVPAAEADAAASTELLPVTPITREAIADPENHFYFQTHDTYQVAATSNDHPLAIILKTPDGLCFVEYGYFIFDVTLQHADLWLRDVSALFDSYASLSGDAAWPDGEYRVLYCIDGQIAGEYAFTLE